MSNERTSNVIFRESPKILSQLKRLARRHETSVSYIIRRLVRDEIARENASKTPNPKW